MELVACIRENWGWVGIDPVAVVDRNDFGNVLVRDVGGRIWWIRPELLSCEVVAKTEAEYARLRADPEFVLDWEMRRLVQIARAKVGALEAGRCYSFKIPTALGAPYEAENMATLNTEELIKFSGYVANEIRDLPDGTPVEIPRPTPSNVATYRQTATV